MMKIHLIANNVCLMTAAVCLGAGYIPGGYWLIMPVLLVMTIFRMVMNTRSVFWPVSSQLVVYVFLAAVGVAVNLSLPLMVIGCTAALASWDLTRFNQSLVGNPPPEAQGLLEKYHMQSLTVMCGASLLLVSISSIINMQLPFGVIVFLILTAVGCLVYSVKYISEKAGREPH